MVSEVYKLHYLDLAWLGKLGIIHCAAEKGTVMPIAAVIFDMDGVIIESEGYWWDERQALAAHYGRIWTADDQRQTMGTSTHEWSALMCDRLGLDMSLDRIADMMIQRISDRLAAHLTLLPGAVEAVKTAASAYPVALASGSPAPIITEVMRLTGLDQVFGAIISGDGMKHGKPDPEIYLTAAKALGVDPVNCLGIEDSTNGIRALKAAGMVAIAIPSKDFPPPDDVLALANTRLASLTDFSLDLIKSLR